MFGWCEGAPSWGPIIPCVAAVVGVLLHGKLFKTVFYIYFLLKNNLTLFILLKHCCIKCLEGEKKVNLDSW